MKKIDIEKWERKTPELPSDFFAEMQKNVLANTIEKQEPKRFSLQVVWSSVAAVIVIVFGVINFYNPTKNESGEELSITEKQEIPKLVLNEENIEIEEILPSEIVDNEVNIVQEKSLVSQKEKKDKSEKLKNLAQKVQMEEILNSMTEKELTDLAMNYEQDVYFELY